MNIEKNIPLAKSIAGRPPIYNFGNMEVGDSMFFEGESIAKGCKQYGAATIYGRNHGWKFKGRTVDGGVRVWRVA